MMILFHSDWSELAYMDIFWVLPPPQLESENYWKKHLKHFAKRLYETNKRKTNERTIKTNDAIYKRISRRERMSSMRKICPLPGNNRILLTYDDVVDGKLLYNDVRDLVKKIREANWSPTIAWYGGTHGSSDGKNWTSGPKSRKSRRSKLLDLKLASEDQTIRKLVNQMEGAELKFYDAKSIDYVSLQNLLKSGAERLVVIACCHSFRDEAVLDFLKGNPTPENEIIEEVFKRRDR